MLGRLFREPLVIFVIVAAAIFVWDARRDVPDASGERAPVPASDLGTIRVPEGLRTLLREEYAWREGQPPDVATERAMLEEWLDDEIVFRAALLQGMHLNDGKVREHLIEKMRLLWIGSAAEPREEDLVAYYLEQMESYRAEPRVSFDHVFFAELPDYPDAVLARLRGGQTVEGDDYWLGSRLQNYAESILRNTFGGDFYHRVSEAKLDEWIGPLESPRGYHFVRVTDRRAAMPLAYREVRSRVRADWQSSQTRSRIAARIDEVREDFTVIAESEDE